MFIKKFLFVTLVFWSFAGCAKQEYTKQESVFIVFKTSVFRYADLGFMYENTDEIKVDIYSNGQTAMKLEIKKRNICISSFECLDKKSFNKKVLSEYYPSDILSHILRGENIFFGKDIVKIRNGFTQKIFKKDKYNISYIVLNKQIIFRDTINDILIKVKRLK